MPPLAADHHAARVDLVAAFQVLARHIHIIERALIDGKQRRITDTARLQAAEFWPPQGERRAFGRCLDDFPPWQPPWPRPTA